MATCTASCSWHGLPYSMPICDAFHRNTTRLDILLGAPCGPHANNNNKRPFVVSPQADAGKLYQGDTGRSLRRDCEHAGAGLLRLQRLQVVLRPLGVLLSTYVSTPEAHPRWEKEWRGCTVAWHTAALWRLSGGESSELVASSRVRRRGFVVTDGHSTVAASTALALPLGPSPGRQVPLLFNPGLPARAPCALEGNDSGSPEGVGVGVGVGVGDRWCRRQGCGADRVTLM